MNILIEEQCGTGVLAGTQKYQHTVPVPGTQKYGVPGYTSYTSTIIYEYRTSTRVHEYTSY